MFIRLFPTSILYCKYYSISRCQLQKELKNYTLSFWFPSYIMKSANSVICPPRLDIFTLFVFSFSFRLYQHSPRAIYVLFTPLFDSIFARTSVMRFFSCRNFSNLSLRPCAMAALPYRWWWITKLVWIKLRHACTSVHHCTYRRQVDLPLSFRSQPSK